MSHDDKKLWAAAATIWSAGLALIMVGLGLDPYLSIGIVLVAVPIISRILIWWNQGNRG